MTTSLTESLAIAEVAARTGLTPDTLRCYERAGLLLAPVSREPSRHRRYAEADLGWLRLLTKLRATGMPIRRLKAYAALARAGAGTEARRLAILEEHRAAVVARLTAMQDALAAIDRKLAADRAPGDGAPDAGDGAPDALMACTHGRLPCDP